MNPTGNVIAVLIILIVLNIVTVQGVLCYNCFYKENDPTTHSCLYPSNSSTVDCKRDGPKKKDKNEDLNDKCSLINGTDPEYGFVVIRTCSRGKARCKVKKERGHVIKTNEGKIVEIFLLKADSCICTGTLCNNNEPTKGKFKYQTRRMGFLARLTGDNRGNPPAQCCLNLKVGIFLNVYGIIFGNLL